MPGRYSLLLPGESPCARVGQNSLYLPPTAPSSGKGKVLIVGGANPSGSFSDSYVIDLDAHCWRAPGWQGLLPRYEHAAFIPASQPTSLWVFGGASETGNRSCMQVLDLQTGTWKSPNVIGTPPSPRTYHTSSAAIGDRLYIFGGGDKGVDPVRDQQLHVFDSATLTWLQPEVRGNPPAPRHGHVVVAIKNRLFIHGGLAGDTFYDDLFSFDITEMKWEPLLATGSVPGGRAAHSAAAFQGHLYIFGGMDPTGELDTMYKYHIAKGYWTRLEFKTPAPPARLDHSMCIIRWKAPSSEDNSRNEVAEASDADNLSKSCPEEHLCLIFGGMDIKGEIYKDCAVTLLE
ncbi:rab9 effector protein with kelch motifs isoform X2 [Rhineura floridana]|uniref:rab9 effector protein with kelch motifs isoform X2 n=1 Tax=Rhineura floridana TaxID=261503 RepID=UPI002AC8889D|nr:rab9 effector protein with kelch motifs isoform X2 [Rhineura floridana]